MEMYNPYSLQGKRILITGASSGIGKATAIECAKLGATLIVTGRDTNRLNDTFLSLKEISTLQHLQIISDLSTEEGIMNLVEQLPEIDGCVSNAGIVGLTPVQFY